MHVFAEIYYNGYILCSALHRLKQVLYSNLSKSIIYLLTNLRSQTTLTVHLSGHSSRCEAEAAVLSISVTSDLSRKMAFNKSDHYYLIFVFKHTIKFEYDITQTTRTLFVGGFCWNERVTCIKYIVLGKDIPYLFKMLVLCIYLQNIFFTLFHSIIISIYSNDWAIHFFK
jgi:hypothetical protein